MDDELARIREKRMQELKEQMQHKDAAGAAGTVTDVDENHFEEFINSNPCAVIDFWAEWCGPCRRVAPSIEELAREFAGRVAFGKCNTDENHRIAMELYITAIPAIMLFSNGQLADQIIGAYPKEAIREKIIKRFSLG